MRKMIKCIVVLSVFLTVFINYYVFAKADMIESEDENLFEIDFFVEYDNTSLKKNDLSGIKIDIYSSEISDYNKKTDMTTFEHSYAFSVYSDNDGRVSFIKPSSEFLIMIDVSSLPDNTGVETQTVFYRNSTVQDIIEIAEIDHVEIERNELAENGILVTLYSKAGKRINGFYSIYENYTDYDVKSIIMNSRKKIGGIVSVGERSIPYEYDIVYSNKQRLELIKEAVDENIITKEEALQLYFDIFYEHGISSELYDYVTLLKNDLSFYNTLSEEQINYFNQILSVPSYNKSYSLGRFEIRYESYSSTTPNFILSTMSALQNIDASLCGGLSLAQPRSNSSGPAKFYLYVTSATSSDGSKGECFSTTESGIRISYIVIYEITDLNATPLKYQNSTVAHEYMHAIVHIYGNNPTLPGWFKEAWSEWARFKVYGINYETCDQYFTNSYLSHTYISLFTNHNIYNYGKYLYPLYLKQIYGSNGDAVVANIIKQLIYTTNVLTAIDNALYGTDTFDSVFPDYMRFLYKPRDLFAGAYSYWSNHPYISYNYGLNSYPNNVFCNYIEPVAADYREFSVPSTTPYHLDITVNITNNSSDCFGKLIMTNNYVITNWNLSASGSLLTYSINIWDSYSKGCLMFVNTNKNSSIGYYLTIARS